MTLSDVKGERTFEVLADVFEAVGDIAKDKNVYKYFQPQATPKGMSQSQQGAQIMFGLVTVICRDHKQECVKIMASIEGVSPEEYMETLDISKLFMDLVDLLNDPQVQQLFFSQTPTTSNTKTDSGPASGNTTKKKGTKAS